MSPKWFIGFLIAFIVLTMLSNTIELVDPLGEPETTVIGVLMGLSTVEFKSPTGILTTAANLATDTIVTFWRTISFDYSYLSTSEDPTASNYHNFLGVTMRIVFCCISMGFLISLALYLVRGFGG